MKEIYLLVDYKNIFGSKESTKVYRSGMDKDILRKAFKEYDINTVFVPFSEVDFSKDWSNKLVLYTSSEDNDLKYKSYIEDIVYGLELSGAIVIPRYSLLKANSNKVFMEILRASFLKNECGNDTRMFGTLEEAKRAIGNDEIIFPVVFKTSEGACSTGVRKAETPQELEVLIKSMCATKNFRIDVHDLIRSFRHKGYVKDSLFRNKFITQKMIPELKYDWKLLIFGNKIFNLKRHVRKHDFRASGSHNDYKIGSESGLTSDMMDYAYDIYTKLNVPMLSFDLAFDGKKCHMIEMQAVYFGSSTFFLSKDYYCKENGEWILKPKTGSYEELYVWSINEYLINNKLK